MICKAIIKINFVYTATQDTHNLTAELDINSSGKSN